MVQLLEILVAVILFVLVCVVATIAYVAVFMHQLKKQIDVLTFSGGGSGGGGSGTDGVTGPTGTAGPTGPTGGGEDITIPLPVVEGGTQQTALNLNSLLLGQGTNPVGFVAPNSSETYMPLISNGSGAAPRYHPIISAGRRVQSTPISESRSFQLADANSFLLVTEEVTLTIPTNASAAFIIGTEIDLFQDGTDSFTLAPAGGVQFNSAYDNVVSATPNAIVTIKKIDTNRWVGAGLLTTV